MPTYPSNPQRALGQRIKQLRAAHEITQEELADRSGMFRTYMSRVETGVANPTLTGLYAIAKALRVDIKELFEAADKEPPARVKSRQPLARGRVSKS